MVKVLLEAGDKVNAEDDNGFTPLDMTEDKYLHAYPTRCTKYTELPLKHGVKTGREIGAEAKQGQQ